MEETYLAQIFSPEQTIDDVINKGLYVYLSVRVSYTLKVEVQFYYCGVDNQTIVLVLHSYFSKQVCKILQKGSRNYSIIN